MLTDGIQAFYLTPAYALAPALGIAFAALAFGLSGEAFARALNPLLWTADRRARARRAFASPVSSASLPDQLVDSADSLLEVKDLVVTFRNGDELVDVVKGVSFSMRKGEMVAIVGELGSGKTMTAMGIAQLIPFPGGITGGVKLADRDLRTLSHHDLSRFLGTDLAVVFQDPMSSLNPALKSAHSSLREL